MFSSAAAVPHSNVINHYPEMSYGVDMGILDPSAGWG